MFNLVLQAAVSFSWQSSRIYDNKYCNVNNMPLRGDNFCEIIPYEIQVTLFSRRINLVRLVCITIFAGIDNLSPSDLGTFYRQSNKKGL